MNKNLLRDILQWDVISWSTALRYWEKNVQWEGIQNGLELGARQGGLSLWLSLKGKSVICSDARDIRRTAEPLHFKYGVGSLVEYKTIDVTNIPYENFFDLIVFKSLMGAVGWDGDVGRQKKAFREIYKALKPGGKLLFAENLAASPLHQSLRRKFVKWGNHWRYITLAEMKEFLKDFSTFDTRTTGFLGALGGSEKRRSLLSWMDDLVLNRIVPRHWKYIVYGIAEK